MHVQIILPCTYNLLCQQKWHLGDAPRVHSQGKMLLGDAPRVHSQVLRCAGRSNGHGCCAAKKGCGGPLFFCSSASLGERLLLQEAGRSLSQNFVCAHVRLGRCYCRRPDGALTGRQIARYA